MENIDQEQLQIDFNRLSFEKKMRMSYWSIFKYEKIEQIVNLMEKGKSLESSYDEVRKSN